MARMTRKHNDSNVLCLGGRISGEHMIQDIVDNWLLHDFDGGRHAISLGLVAHAEEEMTGPPSRGLSQARPDEML